MPPVAPVLRHEHAVAGAVAQRVHRGLFPREVGRLGHQLVGLHHAEVGQATEVGLVAPDALVVAHHRVVVRRRVLVVEVVAVHRHPVARLPGPHGRPHPQHHARGVAADHLIGLVVAAGPLALAGQARHRAEGADRLEQAAPHGVEVEAAGHDREIHLVGRQLGCGHLADVHAPAWILLLRRDPCPHLLLALQHMGGAVLLGNGQSGDVGTAGTLLDGLEDLLHRAMLPSGRCCGPSDDRPVPAVTTLRVGATTSRGRTASIFVCARRGRRCRRG